MKLSNIMFKLYYSAVFVITDKTRHFMHIGWVLLICIWVVRLGVFIITVQIFMANKNILLSDRN